MHYPSRLLLGFSVAGCCSSRADFILTEWLRWCRQEKATIDNRLARQSAALAEGAGVADMSDEIDDASLPEDTSPANEFQFEGLPQPGADSAVSRHIESRKRYSRTASGAVAAIVIYALWDIIRDAILP